MKKITALRLRGGRGKRVNVFLDGKLAFSLEAEVAAREGLQVELELSAERIEALARAESSRRCLDAAIRYLSYRPRSEAELRKRLHGRRFGGDNVEAVITRLREQCLVDDTAFAQFWKDNRESFSPRSRWLTRLELTQKGVAGDIIEPVVATINDDDSAYRALLGKSNGLACSDYQTFRRRLGEYLKRRGFSGSVIDNAVVRVWQEQGGDAK